MSSLGEAVLTLNADGSKLNAALATARGQVTKALGDMSMGFASVGSSLSSIGGSITRSVTLPLVALGAGITLIGANALKTGADFEKAMSGVQAILGATSDDLVRLKELAMNLGLDPNLIVSASQAAGVMEELAKNGLTTQQILDGAAESAIALANATGTDFSTAAGIASTAMQLFNLNAEQMTSVVNTVTGVANASRFSVEDFAQAMAMGGGVASAMGIPIEDFATAVAGLSTSFSGGSDAGTSFKVFLQRLAADTVPAIDAMKDLGLITEEDGNRFFDTEGNMKSLSEIAGILQVAFKDLSDEQKILALTNIFGTDAMRAANAMAELGTAGFEKLSEAMAKTDAAANAATRMDNLSGAMEILSGVVETFKIRFTDAVGPGMRSIVETFTKFMSENSVSIERLFTSLASVFAGFAGNFSLWINQNGPAMIAVFEKLIQALPGFISKMVEIGTVAAPQLQKLFDAFMNAKPESIVKIMEAIGALAVLGPVLAGLGGLITTLVSLGSAISSVVGFFGGLSAMITGIGTGLAALGAFILTPIGALLLLGAAIVGVYLLFKMNIGGIRTTVEQLGFIIKFKFNEMINNIKSAFNINWSELGKKIIDGLVAGLKNGVAAVVGAAKSVANSVLSAVKGVFKIKSPSLAFAEIGDSGQGFVQGLQRSMAPQMMAPVMRGALGGAAQAASNVSHTSVTINNPSPEPASRSVDKTLKKLSYLGVLK